MAEAFSQYLVRSPTSKTLHLTAPRDGLLAIGKSIPFSHHHHGSFSSSCGVTWNPLSRDHLSLKFRCLFSLTFFRQLFAYGVFWAGNAMLIRVCITASISIFSSWLTFTRIYLSIKCKMQMKQLTFNADLNTFFWLIFNDFSFFDTPKVAQQFSNHSM